MNQTTMNGTNTMNDQQLVSCSCGKKQYKDKFSFNRVSEYRKLNVYKCCSVCEKPCCESCENLNVCFVCYGHCKDTISETSHPYTCVCKRAFGKYLIDKPLYLRNVCTSCIVNNDKYEEYMEQTEHRHTKNRKQFLIDLLEENGLKFRNDSTLYDTFIRFGIWVLGSAEKTIDRMKQMDYLYHHTDYQYFIKQFDQEDAEKIAIDVAYNKSIGVIQES